MAVFGPVVDVAADHLLLAIVQFVPGCTIESNAVSDDGRVRSVALARLLHEGKSCVLVPSLRYIEAISTCSIDNLIKALGMSGISESR